MDNNKIVVAGDVTIDWLQWDISPKEDCDRHGKFNPNWQLYDGTCMVAKPGGALLLASMVRDATRSDVITHKLKKRLENIPPADIIHSNSVLGKYPYTCDKKHEKELVYRVSYFCGFSGPDKGKAGTHPIFKDNANAKLVVIDDAGNGYRDRSTDWPRAIKINRKPIVILKMSRPLSHGKLWDHLVKEHPGKLIVVIDANALRECGMDISRRLSWERTAEEFVWQMANNRAFEQLAACRNLVVRFGIDGAIHYSNNNGKPKATLYYNPQVVEGGCEALHPGRMQGLTCAFVAALTAKVAARGIEGIDSGVKKGIICAGRLYKQGFGKVPKKPDYPGKKIFSGRAKDDPDIAGILIPGLSANSLPQKGGWTILHHLTRKKLEEVAYHTVVYGSHPVFKRVPIGRFGKLETVDRVEIESYNSIKNLMTEYIDNDKPEKPLSIAVFGPPGSGKSFGVTELAKTIAPDKVKRLEFNVSQFDSLNDLVDAFHKVRDTVLEGKIPLVFFDEFDSKRGKEFLGWLKSFLAPMQDGKFKDGESMHPIGKAIFVFAGGTSHTFKEFCREELSHGEDRETSEMLFRDAKGPDFLSRLRGYVNILGPNPSKTGTDDFYIIRRSMLFRYMLKDKASQIFDVNDKARVDPGVLRAMLMVPDYKHGTRSMVALIEMSMLKHRRTFEPATLPPENQLEMHVDSDIFSKLVLRDVLFGDSLEKLARVIHEKYLEDQKHKLKSDDPTNCPWDKLNESYKKSNRQFAYHIPEKLQRIGYSFNPINGHAVEDLSFSKREIEIIAQMEHERWCAEKIADGWKYGKVTIREKKIHCCLVPWEKLPEPDKKINRNMVKPIPYYLSTAGFVVYSLK